MSDCGQHAACVGKGLARHACFPPYPDGITGGVSLCAQSSWACCVFFPLPAFCHICLGLPLSKQWLVAGRISTFPAASDAFHCLCVPRRRSSGLQSAPRSFVILVLIIVIIIITHILLILTLKVQRDCCACYHRRCTHFHPLHSPPRQRRN